VKEAKPNPLAYMVFSVVVRAVVVGLVMLLSLLESVLDLNQELVVILQLLVHRRKASVALRI
jgi:hypothetical protein